MNLSARAEPCPLVEISVGRSFVSRNLRVQTKKSMPIKSSKFPYFYNVIRNGQVIIKLEIDKKFSSVFEAQGKEIR